MPEQPVDRACRERGEQAAAFLLTHFRPWMETILQAGLDAFRDRLQHDTPGPAPAAGQGPWAPVGCSCGETFTSVASPNRPWPYSTGLTNRWLANAVLPTLQMNVA